MQPVIRPLSVSDIPDAMALVTEAGWNQTSADWQRFLAATPDGCFKALVDERLVGTVTTMAYDERLAWIGMMLVDREHQRSGIGRLLMEAVLAFIDRARIQCAMLDATPAGQGLYEKYGFAAEEPLERWELVRDAAIRSGVTSSGKISEQVLDIDRTLFGADRRALLRSLAAETPEFAIEAVDGGDLRGYAFGRRGTRADHLGPWVAREKHVAEQLLDAFLERSTRSLIYVDCLVNNEWAVPILRARGFHLSRPLTRMRRGPRPLTDSRADPNPVGSPRMLAILGPEFG